MSNPIYERLEKLLRLAVDPAVTEGEQTNACVAFVKQVRAINLTFDDVISALAPARPAATSASRSNGWETVIMPFGKHRGETLRDIAYDDPGYLRWMVENVNFERGDLAEAVIEAYEYTCD